MQKFSSQTHAPARALVHTHIKRLRVEQLTRRAPARARAPCRVPLGMAGGLSSVGRWVGSLAVPPVVCNLSNPVFNISMHQQFARHETAVKNAPRVSRSRARPTARPLTCAGDNPVRCVGLNRKNKRCLSCVATRRVMLMRRPPARLPVIIVIAGALYGCANAAGE